MYVDDLTRKIVDAAEYLDKKVPGWANLIDIDRLRMESAKDCILGQLYGDYYEALGILGIQRSDLRTALCGGVMQWKYQIELRRDSMGVTADGSAKMVALISYAGNTMLVSDCPKRIAGAEEALKAAEVNYTKFTEVK